MLLADGLLCDSKSSAESPGSEVTTIVRVSTAELLPVQLLGDIIVVRFEQRDCLDRFRCGGGLQTSSLSNGFGSLLFFI